MGDGDDGDDDDGLALAESEILASEVLAENSAENLVENSGLGNFVVVVVDDSTCIYRFLHSILHTNQILGYICGQLLWYCTR